MPCGSTGPTSVWTQSGDTHALLRRHSHYPGQTTVRRAFLPTVCRAPQTHAETLPGPLAAKCTWKFYAHTAF